MTAVGVLVVLLAAFNAVFLGWLANRSVRSWREEDHVDFLDLKVLGQERTGSSREQARSASA